MVPIFHAFLDDNGHLTSMDSARYLSLLQNTVWSKLWYVATRSFLCWMQNDTTTHFTNSVVAFINEKFRGWFLSWRTANPRLAHTAQSGLQSPKLLFLGGCAKSGFSRKNLTQSTHWYNVWKVSPKGYSQETISRVSKNVLKHATLCLEAGGDHFQHIL